VIFDIVFNHIYFDNVFPETVVLNIRDLRILISLLNKIVDVILLHFFDYFDQTVIESCGQAYLLVVFFLKIAKLLNVYIVFLYHNVALFEH